MAWQGKGMLCVNRPFLYQNHSESGTYKLLMLRFTILNSCVLWVNIYNH